MFWLIAIGAGVWVLLLLLALGLARSAAEDDGPVSLDDALKDGWGDEDPDFDCPDFDWSDTDCAGGDDPDAYRSASTSRAVPRPESSAHKRYTA